MDDLQKGGSWLPRQRKIVNRGNIIGPRLHERLTELSWGAETMLLAKLNRMAALLGYAELGELTQAQLSRLRHGTRGAYDYEVAAIADILQVNVYWLLGRSDRKEPPPDVKPLLND